MWENIASNGRKEDRMLVVDSFIRLYLYVEVRSVAVNECVFLRVSVCMCVYLRIMVYKKIFP